MANGSLAVRHLDDCCVPRTELIAQQQMGSTTKGSPSLLDNGLGLRQRESSAAGGLCD